MYYFFSWYHLPDTQSPNHFLIFDESLLPYSKPSGRSFYSIFMTTPIYCLHYPAKKNIQFYLCYYLSLPVQCSNRINPCGVFVCASCFCIFMPLFRLFPLRTTPFPVLLLPLKIYSFFKTNFLSYKMELVSISYGVK